MNKFLIYTLVIQVISHLVWVTRDGFLWSSFSPINHYLMINLINLLKSISFVNYRTTDLYMKISSESKSAHKTKMPRGKRFRWLQIIHYIMYIITFYIPYYIRMYIICMWVNLILNLYSWIYTYGLSKFYVFNRFKWLNTYILWLILILYVY